MYKIIFVTVLFLTFCSKSCIKCSENSNDEDDSFVPTHEWQVVKKGQKIPKGLHVRINFESGVTEAKFLDENTAKETKAVAQVPDAGNSNTKNPADFQELKEALKNIKGEEIKEETTRKFRNYEELKEDLSELKIRHKTDFELLKELTSLHKKLQKSKENEELIVSIIEDLEYLVHQFDNANDFVTLNGFVDIIYPNLNSTSVDIKSGTLKLFGSCVQNNAKVQIHALETGAVAILLKALVLNADHEIKSRAIYALSSLMRRFPLAQTQFLDSAGLNVFEELLQKSTNIKLLLKIVTLIHDLILEHDDALKDTNNLDKIKQYDAVNLKRKLKDQNWCPYLVTLLGSVIKVDVSDHDAVEKILNAIISSDVCNILDNLQLQTLISHLQSYYKVIIKVDNDKYFQQLLDLCNSVVRPLKHKSEL